MDGRKRNPSCSDSQETQAVTTLIISKVDNDAETRIGKLVFTEDGSEPTLVVEGSGPDAAGLRAAWQQIAARPRLPMAYTETIEEEGQKVTEFLERLVPKGDKLYPKAVWSVLEKKHRYLVDRE